MIPSSIVSVTVSVFSSKSTYSGFDFELALEFTVLVDYFSCMETFLLVWKQGFFLSKGPAYHTAMTHTSTKKIQKI